MKNQIKIGAALSYLSVIMQMIIQLLYTPVMINLLGQNEYGLYTLVGSVVSYLSLLSFGATGAYTRFYMRFRQNGDQHAVGRLNGMFLTIFLIMSAAAIFTGGILVQFAPQIFGNKLSPAETEKAAVLMRILVFNIALTFPSSVFDSIVSAHEHFIFQRILSLLTVLFNPLICLPLLLAGHGSTAIVIITLILSSIKLVINIWYCIKKLKVQFIFRQFDFSLLNEILVFSSFVFINMIIDQVNWSVDKYILGRVAGTGEVAVYGVGATINSAFIGFSTAISSVFAPKINEIAAAGKNNMMYVLTELFTKIGRVQYIILGLIASGFVIFGKYFITDIYVTHEYEQSYYTALMLILPAMIPLIQNTGIEIQRALNKHKFRSLVYFAMAIINIIISIPLAKLWGSTGSALGTAIGLITANGLIMNIYYHKAIGINIMFFWKSILKLSKGLIIPFIAGAFIMNFISFGSIFEFALWVLFYMIIYCLSVFILGMNNDEKESITGLIKLKINKNPDK